MSLAAILGIVVSLAAPAPRAVVSAMAAPSQEGASQNSPAQDSPSPSQNPPSSDSASPTQSQAAPKAGAETPPATETPQPQTPSEKPESKTEPAKPQTTTPKKRRRKPKPKPAAPTNAATDSAPPKKVVTNGSTAEPQVQISPNVSQQQASSERQSTSDLLASADENLKKISSRQLNASQQEMASQVRQYIEQANTATAAGDLESARTLALKAQLLSVELVKP